MSYQNFVQRLIVALMLLAALMKAIKAQSPAEPVERFVPADTFASSGTVLEVRPEASVLGEEVRLKNVCRWSDAHKAAMAPVADLVLMRLKKTAPYRQIALDEIRQILGDAGINMASVRFSGSTSCMVNRMDVNVDEREALEQWINSKSEPATRPATAPTAPLMPPGAPDAVAVVASAKMVDTPQREPEAVDRSLRDHLLDELAQRLGVPREQLHIQFSPADDRLLNLREPHFKFSVKTPYNRNLGDVTWAVTVISGETNQKASISGIARAWQSQLVVNRPIGYRQTIRETDLIDRRTLVDRINEDPMLTREQTIGQMASRDLKPGTVMTARLVEPTIMVRSGQLVSVTMTQGTIEAKSVAKAMEQGTLGQAVRVKNESTGHAYDVVITGPQSGRIPTDSNLGRPDLTAARQ